ncbi:MAG: hypothetical protein WCH83_00955 [Alphaproteobacteria bacterium]
MARPFTTPQSPLSAFFSRQKKAEGSRIDPVVINLTGVLFAALAAASALVWRSLG